MKAYTVTALAVVTIALSSCVTTNPDGDKDDIRASAAAESIQVAQLYYAAPPDKAAPPGYTFPPARPTEMPKPAQSAEIKAKNEEERGLPGLRFFGGRS